MRVRLGTHASGAGPDHAHLVKGTPPARRKAKIREMSTLLHAPGHVGLPPTMNADAASGSSRMAYQSASVAMNLCESEKFALVRLAGATSRAHSANRTEIAQRARAGCCPCCSRATHVALPPAYALDEFRNLKVRGLSAGNFRAPTWDKRLAHSKTWDRAAATHAKPTNTLQPRVPAAKPTPRLPTVATNRCLLQRRPCELLRERVAGCQGSGNCVTEESCSSRPRSYASKRSPSAPGDDFGTPPH